MLKEIIWICTLYYGIPLLSIGFKSLSINVLGLMLIMPIGICIISYIYSKKNGFKLTLPILSALLFVPTILLWYNSSAFIYILEYGLLSLLFAWIGSKA